MSENTNNRLYLMITITNRVMGATHFLSSVTGGRKSNINNNLPVSSLP